MKLLMPTLFSLVVFGSVAITSLVAPSQPEIAVVEITQASGGRWGGAPRKPVDVGYPTFASPHANPIAISGEQVFVANTPASTIDVIEKKSKKIKKRVHVGIDPVSVSVRPDGKEVWVSNHVSDSVSVIDNDPSSPTYLQVVATVQEFDSSTKATTFDEPVGIAFASNEKAYVALSSENQIAVVDVPTRKISHRLKIPAQDPRSIVVRDGRLYVIPFESNNKTQLSGGSEDKIDGDLVTFDAWKHYIANNNVLSLGHVVDIIKHPQVPDRDLFIFDTKTDELIGTVDSLGTLLYGVAVDSQGKVFIAQTDARNDVNGRSGTKKHGMKEMENRAFLNRITNVSFGDGGGSKPAWIDIEPLPPQHPNKDSALATPYAIQLSGDDATIIATAAGSDKLFTVDAVSGKVMGRVAVGAVPRGIALENTDDGKPLRAWVYNAVADTISVVDLSDTSAPKIDGFVKLEDPTHKQVKLGRTWFNSASVSSTGTFSCESCHPDCNTDQLLWVLQTPIVTGGDQIMPRSTMPVRGLRDTAPFHWDGVLGDPYGGNNSANVYASIDAIADPTDQTTSTRHLVDVSMAEILMAHGDTRVNDEGKPGGFTAAERDDLAMFLLSVPFPPAQRRAYDNVLSEKAGEGFRLFHIEGDLDPKKDRPFVCGDCHRMPFLVSTNTPGTGMEAPTWRGAYDRYLILPQGRLNIVDFPFYREIAERGQPEEEMWRLSWANRSRMNPVWRMVVEGSTGFSGSFARQFTVSQTSVNEELTADLMKALRVSAAEGGIVLEGEGVLVEEGKSVYVELQYDPDFQDGVFVSKSRDRAIFACDDLVGLAREGKFVGTFIGRHGKNADVDSPQPALWTLGNIYEQRGRQAFPIVHSDQSSLTLSGRNFGEDAIIYVDGRRVEGTIEVTDNDQEQVNIRLKSLPDVGMHFIQVQSLNGRFSNDFIFHVASDAAGAVALQDQLDAPHVGPTHPLLRAVSKGDVDQVAKLLSEGNQINGRYGDGSTSLSVAALFGQVDMARYLIEKGANVDTPNNDGNTPLHIGAFLCRKEIVQLLLDHGASIQQKNNNREAPIDTVAGEWTNGLEEFYKVIARTSGFSLDVDVVRASRHEMVKLLKEHESKAK